MNGWLLVALFATSPGAMEKTELWFDTGPACQQAAEAVRKFDETARRASAHALCIPVSGSLPDAITQGELQK